MIRSKPDLSKYAVNYIRRGMSCIPIPLGTKNPNLKGWQKLCVTEEDVPSYFGEAPMNMGILLGDPSGGVVDVDQDVPEAEKIADRFLPSTVLSGRKEAPRSHRWYVSPGSKNQKWKDIGGKMLLELRSTGCQTLVEPSMHPSGDRYEWDRSNGSDMTSVVSDDLSRMCNELATATIIARNLPPIGGRHDYALALAGYLLRRGRFDADTTLKVLLAGWHAGGGDSKDAVKDIKGAVKGTVRKLESGENVVGGPKLDEIVPGLAGVLAKWWGWEKERSNGTEFSPIPPSKNVVWPQPSPKVYCGLAGDIVRVIEPESEADPMALLTNLITAFGNSIGKGAHIQMGADTHYPKLFVALVGESSKGRKGMSWSPIRRLMAHADPDWAESNIAGGLSSGEGLIYAVRERAGSKKIMISDNWDSEDWDCEEPSSGIIEQENVASDDPDVSRLLIMESELASPLKVMKREGNTLSPVIREAWDNGPLQTLTKNSPMKVSGSHVSIIGHITKVELIRHLTETDMANGLANRFLYMMVKRSKQLPFGGDIREDDSAPLVKRLARAIKFGKTVGKIGWSDNAKELWIKVYGDLSEGKPGLFGAVTSRAEAQVVRLATLYAVMDLSETIKREHLEAALAFWRYAEDSARYIFGHATGDPVADAISAALKDAGNEGLTRTEIRDLLKRNKSAESIERALLLLESSSQARKENDQTGGRPVERWFFVW